MRGKKSSLSEISNQKYKLPTGLDNTSDFLGEVIDKQWVVATGGKERIPGFSIIIRNER